MNSSGLVDLSQPVPLFPLPGCVLPHAVVPLQIFEKRYRRMVADSLADRRIIAIALFEGDDWQKDYEGSPPLRPVVCVGRIVRHDDLADGRYNIHLQGLCRARIDREVPHDHYRIAFLEPIEGETAMEIDLTDARQRIDHLLADPFVSQLASVQAVQSWLTDEIATTAVIDLSVMTICDNPEERYLMLCESDILRRAWWLENLLRGLRTTLRVASRFDPQRTEDGSTVN